MNQSEIQQANRTPHREEPQTGHVQTYDRWQLFFLDRLLHLASLNQQAIRGNLDETEVRLVRRAILSTLLDCDDRGVSAEARKIVETRG